jgi:hypothetical protein
LTPLADGTADAAHPLATTRERVLTTKKETPGTRRENKVTRACVRTHHREQQHDEVERVHLQLLHQRELVPPLRRGEQLVQVLRARGAAAEAQQGAIPLGGGVDACAGVSACVRTCVRGVARKAGAARVSPTRPRLHLCQRH